MGCFNAFAAGVFISFGIVNLLPEAENVFKDNLDKDTTFPYAFLICVGAFTFILILEKVMFDVGHDHGTGGGGHGDHGGHGGHGDDGHDDHSDDEERGPGEHGGHGDHGGEHGHDHGGGGHGGHGGHGDHGDHGGS